MIRVLALDELPPARRLRLRWPRTYDSITREHLPASAFAIVALDGDRVVGYWCVGVPRVRGDAVKVNSIVTVVVRRFQRRGLAWRLWKYGIAYWGATKICAAAGSDQGAHFMARAALRLARRGVDTDFDYNCHGDFDDLTTHRRVRRALLKARRTKPRKGKRRAA